MKLSEETVETNSASTFKILVFGYKEFSQLTSSVLAEYEHLAEFKIVDAIVSTTADINKHIAEFKPDAAVSAGANAKFLQAALPIPVVSLEITEQDIYHAIEKAAKTAGTIQFISFARESIVAELAAQRFQVTLTQSVYLTPEQAREQFYIASKHTDIAIVGASLVCGLASAKDIPSFLVYSASSCRNAIEKAIHSARQSRKTADNKALIAWLLQQSKTPIIMVDGQDESITLNQAARRDLELGSEAPVALDMLIHPQDGQRQSDGECTINGCDWWYHLDTVAESNRQKFIYQLYKKQPKASPKPAQQVSRHALIYQSNAMNTVIQQAGAFAASPSNVLLFGESGTGKELVARHIYQAGPYATGKFVALNCSAIPSELFEGELFGHHDGAYTGAKRGGRKGLIEEAQHGALFLDEISELALDQQAKLLRFLQERSFRPLGGNQERDVDLKLIAASNRSLPEMVAQGRFREDLYYRLNVFTISIPPLRARTDDIDAIAQYKLDALKKRYGLSFSVEAILPHIASALKHYHWPGNIREMENVLERIVAYLHTMNDIERLTSALHQIAPELTRPMVTPAACGALKTREQETILAVLDRWQGDKRKAAEELGISQTTLWRRLKSMNQNN